MAFKRMTPQQRSTFAALRALREMVVTPADARPLRALKKRGLLRYRIDEDGVRLAVLRETRVQRNARRRSNRVPAEGLWQMWRAARDEHIDGLLKAAGLTS